MLVLCNRRLAVLAAIALLTCFAMTAHAWQFSTVDSYGGTSGNAVDFEAQGSTLSLPELRSTIKRAYNMNVGAVFQCESASSGVQLKFGASQSRLLTLLPSRVPGVVTSVTWAQAISGTAAWSFYSSNADPSLTFTVDSMTGGQPDEGLRAIALTVLSQNAYPSGAPLDMGTVTMSVTFSDQSTASASRHITEASGLGDTFFGFYAPEGLTISSFSLRSSPGNVSIRYDDIAFITTALPEPSSVLFLGCGALLLMRRRKSR